jgi:hypothetical protein
MRKSGFPGLVLGLKFCALICAVCLCFSGCEQSSPDSQSDAPKTDNPAPTDDDKSAGQDGSSGGGSDTGADSDTSGGGGAGTGSDTGADSDTSGGSGAGTGGDTGSDSDTSGGGAGTGGDTGSSGGALDKYDFSDIAALKAALEKTAENTNATPYKVSISGIDLSETKSLADLYGALTRFVELDLSGCTGEIFPNITEKAAPLKVKIAAITLPESITAIKNGTDKNNGAFIGCAFLTKAILPKVVNVGDYAFWGCAALTEVLLPEAVEIGKYAFSGNTSLAAISMPKVNIITYGAFVSCTSLTSVKIPEVTTITKGSNKDTGAFYNCISLKEISLPKVAAIGDNAFNTCTVLAAVNLGEKVPALGSAVFANVANFAIYVPESAVETYTNTTVENWTGTLKSKIKPLP